MSQTNFLTAYALTLQASSTVSAMTGANALIAVTTSAAHGLVTNDIVQISGVATPAGAANGQWVITVTSTTAFTLNNSLGSGTWSSGGTVAHIGHASPAVLVDNTVFSSYPTQWMLQARVEALASGSNARLLFTDAADSAFVTEQPGPAFCVAGAVSKSADVMHSAKYEDYPDMRMASSGDNFRIKIFVSGGAGSTATVSAWLRY
jgi:hypothetical protein